MRDTGGKSAAFREMGLIFFHLFFLVLNFTARIDEDLKRDDTVESDAENVGSEDQRVRELLKRCEDTCCCSKGVQTECDDGQLTRLASPEEKNDLGDLGNDENGDGARLTCRKDGDGDDARDFCGRNK